MRATQRRRHARSGQENGMDERHGTGRDGAQGNGMGYHITDTRGSILSIMRNLWTKKAAPAGVAEKGI